MFLIQIEDDFNGKFDFNRNCMKVINMKNMRLLVDLYFPIHICGDGFNKISSFIFYTIITNLWTFKYLR
jgi:hypothetical protein